MSSDRRASAGTPDGPGLPATPGAPATSATSGAPGALSGACVVLPLVPGFARPPARRRPLPDAVAVRMLPIPDSAPPYDDEPGGPVPAASTRPAASTGPAASAGPAPGTGPAASTGPAGGAVSPGRLVPPGRQPARDLRPVAGA